MVAEERRGMTTAFQILLITENVKIKALAAAALESDHIPFDLASADDEVMARMDKTSYELVIAEAHLVSGYGNPLLRWIYRQAPEQRVVLITEFSRLTEMQIAMNLGCDSFLP